VKPTSRLWLARHGRPLISSGVCYGALDVAADAEHTRQAAEALHAALPNNIALAAHSPLLRCSQLAQALSELRQPRWPVPRADRRLREMDFGRWEGHPWDAIARTEIDAWTDDFGTFAPGGGESLQAMLVRVGDALAEARQHAAEEGHGDILWITHAGVIRCVQWLLMEQPGAGNNRRAPLAHEWTMPAPEFGMWSCVPLDPPGPP
jgi:alpha-ribazole phosphatase